MKEETPKVDQQELQNQQQETEPETTDALAQEEAQPVDVQAAVQSALKEDRKRQKEIRELGAKFGFTEAAEQFAESGQSVAEFQAHIRITSYNVCYTKLLRVFRTSTYL